VAKIHISDELDRQAQAELARDVRHAVVESLGLAPELGKVIVYSAPVQCRSVHSSRDPAFVLAEVLMFPGRDQEIKNRLYARLNQVIKQHTGVDDANIFINVIESPRGDWGIRGGRPASQVDLGY